MHKHLFMFTDQEKYLDIKSIKPDNIHIQDILASISRIRRFGGQGINEVTVLIHSLHCYYIAVANAPRDYKLQRYMLWHDAGEAFYGDILSPWKKLLNKRFRKSMKQVDNCILARFNIDDDINKELAEQIDGLAARLEFRYVFNEKEDQKYFVNINTRDIKESPIFGLHRFAKLTNAQTLIQKFLHTDEILKALMMIEEDNGTKRL